MPVPQQAAKKPESHGHGGGLEDVVATDSAVCFIDGIRSKLIYRGYSIDELAAHSTFEEVVYLLLNGRLPNRRELDAFAKSLASQRALPKQLLDRMQGIPPKVHPMAVFRTLVSTLSFYDPEAELVNPASAMAKAVRVTAQMPTIMAAWERVRNGQKPIEPRQDLGHAANFLYMLKGSEPDPLFARGLDLYLVLLADHELNASAFTARVTASTLSDFYSAVTAAIGALKGPLHGGANEQVIKMLFEIKEPANVEPWLRDAFAAKKKVMGFGHRVYKTKDPRSPILKEFSRKVCEKTGNSKLFQMLERIEEIVTREKNLPANVDFYSSTLLYAVGVPVEMFTAIFLMSRIAGYGAHYLEQISDNRLIRPRANYKGAMDLPYVPIDQRP
ncbi:MAG: citrate synthase [Elusimicrobia bacterium RIFCSPLOWO2_01_FULL_64_13]|nr:MAG: citrate synthase [Elusimicrobia bacterium RIFCSPHIGHO2_01_FULL_64_10]OGR95121.1 MAG: citrate synthase [Elusimicrobia bacterium RIFCSPLOWO2_01_FULL_64_13]